MRAIGYLMLAVGLALAVAGFVVPATVDQPGFSELRRSLQRLNDATGYVQPGIEEPDIMVPVVSPERLQLRLQLTVAGFALLGVGLLIVAIDRRRTPGP